MKGVLSMYFVYLTPETNPFDLKIFNEWDAAILGLQIVVKANSTKEAEAVAAHLAQKRGLYVKAAQVIEVKGA